MTRDATHKDVAAYALGLLEENDRRAFEVHLGRCARCAEDLHDFTAMAEILHGVPPIEPVTSEENAEDGHVIEMLRRHRVAERRRHRSTAVLGAAAGVALIAGGVIAGLTVADGRSVVPRPAAIRAGNSSGDVFDAGEKVTGTDASTGVTALVAMQSKGWGTSVGLELSHVDGPLVCTLVAVSRTGERHVVTEWRVPSQRDGLAPPPAPVQVRGGTAVSRADIARFDVQVEGTGRTLLSIPVS